MTVMTTTLEDFVYAELRSLGFTDERILKMSEDERKLWVTALLYSDE